MVREIPRYSCADSGKCPHCGVHVRFEAARTSEKDGSPFYLREDPMRVLDGGGDEIVIYPSTCPQCEQPILSVHTRSGSGTQFSHLAHPRNRVRPVSPNVPSTLSKDFLEAVAVIDISEQASAALSRRCLQDLLHSQGYVQNDLSKSIDAALPNLPHYISQNLDAIRNVGNFAAHPMKSASSGSIVAVEPNEAEFSLQILEQLFDHYFDKPAAAKKARDALNIKLVDAGKLPMKTTKPAP